MYSFLIILFFLVSTSSFAQKSYEEIDHPMSSFTLSIEGITDIKGEVRIAIFNSEERYRSKKDPIHAIVLPVVDSIVTWVGEEMSYGDYAIAVYHDKNENGELDTNLLGIPKEAYGFSNDARGKFGPASWDDARFEISSEKNSMTIIIK